MNKINVYHLIHLVNEEIFSVFFYTPCIKDLI